MSLLEQELLRLLAAGESDRVEFKRSAADRQDIRHTICALANDLGGSGTPGVIFFGVDDDGTVCGIAKEDRTARDLLAMRNEGKLLPRPALNAQWLEVQGKWVLALVVLPCENPPMRCDGRVWVRVGTTVQQATGEEETRLAERRRAADLPWDHRPAPEATLEDLDLLFFQREYLPAAVAPELLARNQRSIEQQLRSLRFLAQGKPTFGALLVLGKAPQEHVPGAYVQFLRIGGTTLGDPVMDQKRIAGPLPDQIRHSEQVLEAHITSPLRLDSRSQESVQADYPLLALQQYLRNALIHRNYESSHAPVRVYWYDDRVEIDNPGGLFGQVTPENFRGGATDYRNPLLAEAMRVLGYVQRFGMGIPLAEQALQENGNPEPQYHIEPTRVRVVVRKAP